MTQTVPPASHGRRVRTLVPLHKGLGFGAEAIRARALDVARTAQARHEAKRRDVERTPLGAPLAGAAAQKAVADGLAPDTAVSEAVGVARRAPPAPHGTQAVPHGTQAVPHGTQAVPGGMERLETLNVHGERPDTHRGVPLTRAPGGVGRGLAMAAWGLDGVVAGCVLVLGAVTSYAIAPTPVGRLLAKATTDLVSSTAELFGFLLLNAHAAWMTFLVQSAVMAILGLFFCQLLSVSFFRSTLGRFVVGIELARSHRGVVSRVGLALSEALTLGGLFALPFVLATPKRVPLFSWIRLEANE
ncbi:MAG: hypothetical protein IOD12_03350 [Silvanigrellales bacterium]|nr:hypothetical protein [Silvanigrellales bacterium]